MLAYAAVACRAALALIFGFSALSKVGGNFDAFEQSLRAMRVVPGGTSMAGRAVVAAEAATCLLLILPVYLCAVIAFALAALLMALFAAAILRVVRNGDSVTCRCFGRSTTPLGKRHLARNGLLFAVAVVGFVGSLGAPTITPLTAVPAAAVGLFVGAGVVGMDELTDLVIQR